MKTAGAVVLITGASSGIGAAAARAFDMAGSKVALAARKVAPLAKVAQGLQDALIVPTDMSQPRQARAMIDRTVEKFGRIDVLINNAALIRMMRSDVLSAEDVRPSIETNLIGPMVATQTAAAAMAENGGGHIINISSPGFLIGMPMLAPYAASKAAFSAWTRTVQGEWAERSIVVTEYFPGNIDTVSQIDSDIGVVGPEVYEDPRLNSLTRWLTRKQRPEFVAKQLVECVRRPQPTMYSSHTVRFASLIGLFARTRVRLASRMARVIRGRTGASVFTPADALLPGHVASPPAEQPLASSVLVKKAAERVAARVADKQAAVDTPQISAAEATAEQGVAAAKKPTKKATKKKTTRKTAKSVGEARGEEKAAAAKKPTRKTARKAEAKVSSTAKKKTGTKKSGTKSTRKKATKKGGLSTEAADRVRAAAEKAAASADGERRRSPGAPLAATPSHKPIDTSAGSGKKPTSGGELRGDRETVAPAVTRKEGNEPGDS